jgi:2-oxoisovalerate dehydrogenase E1 component alpha subunit
MSIISIAPQIFHNKMIKAFLRSMSYSNSLSFTHPHALSIPTFQVVNEEGLPNSSSSEYLSRINKDLLTRMYKTMIEVQEFDTLYYDLQRQGLISFYMQNCGEEGLQVATAAALDLNDWIFPQYRELGVFFWRGFDIQQASHQLFSNAKDLGEGKQMPVHYGSKDLNIMTVRSPLATQIPQAAGLGYGLRLKKQNSIAVCYFGDGAASEGDTHAALNIASTTKSHTLFVCRNNKYAISTNMKDQYGSDGIAVRGVAYGIHSVRVDGNDVIATYIATQEAKKLILAGPQPVLMECMTYRRGHHSTSDDASRYRSKEELEHYQKTNNPIIRLEKFLKHMGWLDFDPVEIQKETRDRIIKAKDIAKIEKLPKWEVMFDGVYNELTPELKKQKSELKKFLEIYGDKYEISKYS